MVDIANSMRRQVRLTILLIGDLVLSFEGSISILGTSQENWKGAFMNVQHLRAEHLSEAHTPFIEANSVLEKEQCLIGAQQWSESSGQVEVG